MYKVNLLLPVCSDEKDVKLQAQSHPTGILYWCLTSVLKPKHQAVHQINRRAFPQGSPISNLFVPTFHKPGPLPLPSDTSPVPLQGREGLWWPATQGEAKVTGLRKFSQPKQMLLDPGGCRKDLWSTHCSVTSDKSSWHEQQSCHLNSRHEANNSRRAWLYCLQSIFPHITYRPYCLLIRKSRSVRGKDGPWLF